MSIEEEEEKSKNTRERRKEKKTLNNNNNNKASSSSTTRKKNVFFGRKRRGRPARAPIAERWTPEQRHHLARVRAKLEEIHLFQFNRRRVDHVLARGRKCLVVVEEQKKTGAISRTREGRSDVSAHAERRRGRESSEWRFR